MNAARTLKKLITNPMGALRRVKNISKDKIKLAREYTKFISHPAYPEKVVNQNLIRFIGLRRVGNHAVLNWLEKQIGVSNKSVFHINNVPCGQNPYEYFYQRHLQYENHLRTRLFLKRHAQGRFDPHDTLIYSYEDFSLEDITHPDLESQEDTFYGKANHKYDVLILRDPFNLIASRLKSGFIDVKSSGKNMMDLWLEAAREFVGETNYLTRNKVCINFNRWTIDREYRITIAQALEIPFSDAGKEDVRPFGGGSSFEGQQHQGQGSAMKVLERWTHFVDDPVFRQYFDCPEVWKYSEAIFGVMPGTEQLRRG